MAETDVFRPASGPLLEGSRPATQGGYRFGQLSHNSFFTRHNPHPARVRHLKGLLDVPICSVNDDGYFSNPRYSLQFPPNAHNNKRLQNWKGRIPVNAINVNSQLHPINTITGLQYFSGLQSYPYREKAIPRVGLVPVTEAWRDELANFTKALSLDQVEPAKPAEEPRPRTSQYSADTGRLIPPPSRAMSRGNSRRGRTSAGGFVGGNMQHISADPDMENMVLVMLCQILQTEDVNAVQAWLCSAGEREKDHVMSLVKSAVAGREEYYKQHPAEFLPDAPGKAKLPPIGKPQSPGQSDRLVIEDEGAVVVPPAHAPAADAAAKPVVDDQDAPLAPEAPLAAVFRPAPAPRKATPLQAAPRAPKAPPTPKSPEATRLKYTKSPDQAGMWSQKQSLNTF